MKTIILAGIAALISTSAFAQTAGEFLGQDLRDRGAAYVATDRARENFGLARERAAEGNYVGAAIAQERGEIEVGCEYCGQQYQFDAIDAARLFTEAQKQPPSSAAVQ